MDHQEKKKKKKKPLQGLPYVTDMQQLRICVCGS